MFRSKCCLQEQDGQIHPLDCLKIRQNCCLCVLIALKADQSHTYTHTSRSMRRYSQHKWYLPLTLWTSSFTTLPPSPTSVVSFFFFCVHKELTEVFITAVWLHLNLYTSFHWFHVEESVTRNSAGNWWVVVNFACFTVVNNTRQMVDSHQ